MFHISIYIYFLIQFQHHYRTGITLEIIFAGKQIATGPTTGVKIDVAFLALHPVMLIGTDAR